MYRTTKEENEILTRTARGTPMGEFLPPLLVAHRHLGASQDQADVYPGVRRRSGALSRRHRQGRGHRRLLRPSPREPLSWRCRARWRALSISRLAL